jgi:hypothetical protein
LVKKQVVIGGYESIMETMLDEMLDAMVIVHQKAQDLQAGFEPKAIYVCRTDINQDDGAADLPSRPFVERRAPPILIWRYLVEQKASILRTSLSIAILNSIARPIRRRRISSCSPAASRILLSFRPEITNTSSSISAFRKAGTILLALSPTSTNPWGRSGQVSRTQAVNAAENSVGSAFALSIIFR